MKQIIKYSHRTRCGRRGDPSFSTCIVHSPHALSAQCWCSE